MEQILVGLNEAQKAAVTSPASVLQVLAPPGSGKTKTLTSRVAYLIAHHGLTPRNIIVCTFTVKAAREMKERICGFLGEETANKLILGTFHSVSRRFLAAYGKEIGLDPKFGIADTTDTTSILSRIIKRNDFEIEPAQARARISSLKAKLQTAEAFAATKKARDDQQFATVYIEYQEHLRVSNLLDYDDLLLRCVELLQRFPACVSRIESVLIDEFQDTNSVQFDLMQLFAQFKQSITIVGDPDQSIYGWRSAEIKNLIKMREIFPETLVVVLEENYRSGGSILITAQEVIEQDKARPAKRLMATHTVGLQPVFRKLPNAYKEADWIVFEIQRTRTLSAGLLGLNDYAVLFRSAALSRLVENSLGKAGIPYRMVGGRKFYDRIEVKLVLDYLRVISHPEHNDCVARILNVPPRHVGATSMAALLESAETQQTTLWKFIQDVVRGKVAAPRSVKNQTLGGLASFAHLILKAQERLQDLLRTETLADYLCYLLERLKLKDYLESTKEQDAESRWANVQELVAQAGEFAVSEEGSLLDDEESEDESRHQQQGSTSAKEDALNTFLSNIALSTDVQPVQEEGAQTQEVVTLSTIHAAKGLEWPVVFIPAVYNGSIPHSRAEDTDEERRLLYVAMTRAQSLLYMSRPLGTFKRGESYTTSTANETSISPFMDHRPLDNLLGKRGENISFEVVQELASILRRPCPSKRSVDAAFLGCEFPKDNIWSTTGEEEEDQSKGVDARDENCAPWQSYGRWKRSLTGNATSCLSHYSAKTTVEQQTTYSTSFTTASTALSTMKVETDRVTKDVAHSLGRERQQQLTLSAKSLGSKRKAEDGAAGQASLTLFFPRASNQRLSNVSSNSTTTDAADQKRAAALRDISNEEGHGMVSNVHPRQAVTLHMTSMEEVNVAKRRTLGVRRSRHGGWDARMAKERSTNG